MFRAEKSFSEGLSSLYPEMAQYFRQGGHHVADRKKLTGPGESLLSLLKV